MDETHTVGKYESIIQQQQQVHVDGVRGFNPCTVKAILFTGGVVIETSDGYEYDIVDPAHVRLLVEPISHILSRTHRF